MFTDIRIAPHSKAKVKNNLLSNRKSTNSKVMRLRVFLKITHYPRTVLGPLSSKKFLTVQGGLCRIIGCIRRQLRSIVAYN